MKLQILGSDNNLKKTVESLDWEIQYCMNHNNGLKVDWKLEPTMWYLCSAVLFCYKKCMVGLGPLPSTNSTETFYFFCQTREKYASISSGTTRLIMCGQWKCVYFFIRNYNRGKKKAVSREEAMEELIQVVTTCLFQRVIPMHSTLILNSK